MSFKTNRKALKRDWPAIANGRGKPTNLGLRLDLRVWHYRSMAWNALDVILCAVFVALGGMFFFASKRVAEGWAPPLGIYRRSATSYAILGLVNVGLAIGILLRHL